MLARPSQRRHRRYRETELPIISFVNVLVVLISFLLSTAVFSRLAVLELSLPSVSDQTVASSPVQRLQLVLMIRPEAIEVKAGGKTLSTIPRYSGGYDMSGLSQILRGLKEQYPNENAATLLSHGSVNYQTLIWVMDVSREAGFPEIAVGEARSS